MDNRDLFKLALGGLAAGTFLFGCSKPSPAPDANPPPVEEGETRCSGGPTCASCTVPNDCNDVSDCNEAESPKSLSLKRRLASKSYKA